MRSGRTEERWMCRTEQQAPTSHATGSDGCRCARVLKGDGGESDSTLQGNFMRKRRRSHEGGGDHSTCSTLPPVLGVLVGRPGGTACSVSHHRRTLAQHGALQPNEEAHGQARRVGGLAVKEVHLQSRCRSRCVDERAAQPGQGKGRPVGKVKDGDDDNRRRDEHCPAASGQ